MTRLLHILSVSLITAGLVLFVEIGVTLLYKEPLSSIYASVQQGKAEDELSETEASFPSPATERAVDRIRNRKLRIDALARRFSNQVETGDAIGRIEADGMSLDAVVIQGTDTASLEKGPGHFPETPFPGEGSTVGIAGHRTTYGAPFRNADSMERGDRIELEMPYATIVYRVQKTAIVDPSSVGVVRDTGYERLVLTTCHPLYSAEQRLIVFARAVGARLDPRVRRS